MSSWEQALVIILSVTLTVFLIVTIVAVAFAIQVLSGLKRLTAKAEAAVDKAETITTFFTGVAGPAALVRALRNLADMFKDNKRAAKGRR